MKKLKEMLLDRNGKLSFKRVTALTSYIVSLIISIVVAFYCLDKGVKDANTIIMLIGILSGTGTVQGFSTVFEKENNTIKEDEIG